MDGSLDRVWSGGYWNGSTYTSLHRGSDSVTVVGAHSISCGVSERSRVLVFFPRPDICGSIDCASMFPSQPYVWTLEAESRMCSVKSKGRT